MNVRNWTSTGAVIGLTALTLAGCATARSARDRIVKAPPPCEDIAVQIYFEPDMAEVTREGRQVIAQAASQAKACRIDRVLVLGLADAAGDPAANLALSKKRAAAVTQALAATGLPAAEFDMAAAGQSGATAAGAAVPVRRRADVKLELSPKS